MNISTDITTTALAFRGYNVTNLGRTAELLEVPAYEGVLTEELVRFGDICSEISGQSVDLPRRVREHLEPGVEAYAESIALTVAVEVAHLRLLREQFGFDLGRARLVFGYSLGELVAVCAAGQFEVTDMIRIPLVMAQDSAELAYEVTLGVLFSRGPRINPVDIHRLCQQITAEGAGTIAMSSVLSPNSYLLVGQGQTIARFKEVMGELLPSRAQLRVNDSIWPPLHTPITRQRHIPDRAAVMMESLAGGFLPPCPPVLSLVTGLPSYDDHSARQLLRNWVDHPQLLWNAVDYCLAEGVETILHVGPEPNVIPATFQRLSDNIVEQTSGNTLSSMGMRAVSRLARRTWLSGMLPAQANLLHAPYVRHVILEDWLIENAPK